MLEHLVYGQASLLREEWEWEKIIRVGDLQLVWKRREGWETMQDEEWKVLYCFQL